MIPPFYFYYTKAEHVVKKFEAKGCGQFRGEGIKTISKAAQWGELMKKQAFQEKDGPTGKNYGFKEE